MLSLRSVVHHTRCFRPALTTAPTSSFTTSLPRMDKSAMAYADLFGALAEEGRKKAAEEALATLAISPKVTPAPSQRQTSYGPKQERIRIFRRNKPLHPSEFSRERRVETWRRRPKPWDLGPPSNVSRFKDTFRQLGIDPLDECMNSTLLSNYVTSMGRIEKRAVTKLTSKSQRKLSKAIRRAKMMGIIPLYNKSPFGLTHFPK